MSKKSIKSDLARIKRMKDAEIDYSDIPALDKSFLKKATTAWPPVKQQLTIRLDADVLDWLKSHGRGYQTRINRILRVVMESHPPAARDESVREKIAGSGVRLSSLPPAFQPALHVQDGEAGRKPGCGLERPTPLLTSRAAPAKVPEYARRPLLGGRWTASRCGWFPPRFRPTNRPCRSFSAPQSGRTGHPAPWTAP